MAYLRPHLRACHDAIEAGVAAARVLRLVADGQLRVGLGYDKRFGIVHVDYDTQERRLKDSAVFYSGVIAAGGVDRPVEALDADEPDVEAVG